MSLHSKPVPGRHLNGYVTGRGAMKPATVWQDFYQRAFVERRSLRESCRLVGIARETGRGMHKEIRSFLALGKQHPKLKRN